jgi:hypothetical protein
MLMGLRFWRENPLSGAYFVYFGAKSIYAPKYSYFWRVNPTYGGIEIKRQSIVTD